MKDKNSKNSLIELKDITKIFGSNKNKITVLKNISLKAELGELLLILGPSGSGKTTLLTIIAGLIPQTSGRVTVFNQEYSHYKTKDLQKFRAKNIGFVFQNFLLIDSLTIIENILLVCKFAGTKKVEAYKRAKKLLDLLNISHLEKNIPNEISQGEKQRVAIGRAIVNDADIILADEPTANLDSNNGLEVIRLLHSYAKEKNKCVIVTSHDLRIENFADRILKLEDGNIESN